MAGQLQKILNEADCLDLFQSGFTADYGTKMAWTTLVDDMHYDMGKGCVLLLILLNLPVMVSLPSIMGFFWIAFQDCESLFCGGFSFT